MIIKKINWQKILTIGLAVYPLILIWQTKWIILSDNFKRWQFNQPAIYVSDLWLIALLIIAFYLFSGAEQFSRRRYWFYWLALSWLALGFIGIYSAPDKLWLLLSGFRWLGALALAWLVANFGEKRLSFFLVIAGSLAVGLAVGQFIWQYAPANKFFGLAEHRPEILGVAVFDEQSRILRAYGPFDHPNILGGCLAVIWLILLIERPFNATKYSIIASIWLCGGLLISGSRSGLLAAIIGSVLIAVSTKKQLNRSVWFSGLLTIVCGLILLWPIWQQRWNNQQRLTQLSNNERTQQYQQAAANIMAHPLGEGWGQYVGSLAAQDNFRQPLYAYQPIHNGFGLAAAELGWLGLLIYGGLWLSLLPITGKKLNWSLFSLFLAIFIINNSDHWLYSNHFGQLFWGLIAGYLLPSAKTIDKT